MKRLLIAAALVFSVSGASYACNKCAKPVVSEVIAVSPAGTCAPLPEVCKVPTPVCAPKADDVCTGRPVPDGTPMNFDNIPVVTAPATPSTASVPAAKTVAASEGKAVAVAQPAAPAKPTMKQVFEEETYVENVTRTVVEQEERSRTKTRKIKVPATKVVNQVQVKKVKSMSGKAPRLARPVRQVEKSIMVKETEVYEETYTVPVTVTYTEPVTRTRTISKWVPVEE